MESKLRSYTVVWNPNYDRCKLISLESNAPNILGQFRFNVPGRIIFRTTMTFFVAYSKELITVDLVHLAACYWLLIKFLTSFYFVLCHANHLEIEFGKFYDHSDSIRGFQNRWSYFSALYRFPEVVITESPCKSCWGAIFKWLPNVDVIMECFYLDR